jgi:stress response protein YsnF
VGNGLDRAGLAVERLTEGQTAILVNGLLAVELHARDLVAETVALERLNLSRSLCQETKLMSSSPPPLDREEIERELDEEEAAISRRARVAQEVRVGLRPPREDLGQ